MSIDRGAEVGGGAEDVASRAAAPPRTGEWFGHPKGLTILFATEMWEVFSFFGMKTLLVYYMTQQLLFRQEHASLIYGAYSGTAYLLPIVGGFLCDRWLGRRTAVIVGGSLMAAGHFALTFESLFFPALGLVALGAGLYIPALPSQIGALYDPADPRRSSGYSVYYVGMNAGAFLAPLVCGTLGEMLGWHWGFAVAGIGMLLGVVIYTAGTRHLPPEPTKTQRAHARSVEAPGKDLRARFALIFGVVVAIIVFRGAYEQIGNTVALWLDAGVDRHVAGSLEIPMTWFQSLNPLLIFVLTPFFILYWQRQAREGQEWSPPTKMAAGAVIVALGYLLLAGVSAWTRTAGAIPHWGWIAFFIFLLTAGELLMMPVCLALLARLAPPSLAATTMALFFFTVAGGNFLAGALGAFWSSLPPEWFFAVVAGVALVGGALLLLFVAPLKRLEGKQGRAAQVSAA